MNTVIEITDLDKRLDKWRNQAQSIAFVPTMGGLHAGHLSLIDLANKYADRVVVSIFVNPTQFAQHEDFATYPRMIESDLALLKAKAVDCVFTPDVDMIYPDGIKQAIDVGEVGQILCGKTRPHFFNGVVQAVRRLFDIVRPDIAVFGQKDYQQLHIIKHFTSGVEIIEAPVARERDGLAMSTRNQYLSESERKIAPKLYQTLVQIKKKALDKNAGIEQLKQHFTLDYLEILDANTLKQSTSNTCKIAILCAVFLDSTRLIDNIIIQKDKQ